MQTEDFKELLLWDFRWALFIGCYDIFYMTG